MLAMMGTVIVILLVKVLPVFQQVFRQMGLEMNNFSNGLLNAGVVISRYFSVLMILFRVVSAGVVALLITEKGSYCLRQLCGKLPYPQWSGSCCHTGNGSGSSLPSGYTKKG